MKTMHVAKGHMQSIRNADFSFRAEGCRVSAKTKKEAVSILCGEKTADDIIAIKKCAFMQYKKP